MGSRQGRGRSGTYGCPRLVVDSSGWCEGRVDQQILPGSGWRSATRSNKAIIVTIIVRLF
jgi:hypothetical protein